MDYRESIYIYIYHAVALYNGYIGIEKWTFDYLKRTPSTYLNIQSLAQ